jgi:cell division protein FtsQ
VNKSLPLPLDIRLMNFAAALLAVVSVLLMLGSGIQWLLQHPIFNIQSITVQGEVSRNNAVTLRANVMPQLSGNFFTIDLKRARDAFEAVPWVRGAVVHRDFPNKLKAVLLEHEPMALWGDEGSSKMVNQQSQVFEANVEEVDVDALPRLKGPDDQSDLVVRMFRDLVPIFKAVDMRIEQLELTPRGSWRVLTDGGAQLELGRGTEAEMVAQLKIFFRTLSQITARYGRTPSALAGADLRHKDGYAVRLRGVTTLDVDGKKSP